MRSTIRHGDTMIVVESAPATVAFDDLLAATHIIPDNYGEAPWDNCDGFEHVAKPAHTFDHGEPRDRQGYARTWDRGERFVLTLPTNADYWGVAASARACGASRGVAAEMAAANRRQTLAQLVKWYENGWEWYGVRCLFTALGDKYEASLWGIDDAEYAETLREEIALEVAGQLEAAGYTVTDKPQGQQDWTRADEQERLARHLAAQNWAA